MRSWSHYTYQIIQEILLYCKNPNDQEKSGRLKPWIPELCSKPSKQIWLWISPRTISGELDISQFKVVRYHDLDKSIQYLRLSKYYKTFD